MRGDVSLPVFLSYKTRTNNLPKTKDPEDHRKEIERDEETRKEKKKLFSSVVDALFLKVSPLPVYVVCRNHYTDEFRKKIYIRHKIAGGFTQVTL